MNKFTIHQVTQEHGHIFAQNLPNRNCGFTATRIGDTITLEGAIRDTTDENLTGFVLQYQHLTLDWETAFVSVIQRDKNFDRLIVYNADRKGKLKVHYTVGKPSGDIAIEFRIRARVKEWIGNECITLPYGGSQITD